MSAKVRVLAELNADGSHVSRERYVRIEAKADDEFRVDLMIGAAHGSTEGSFNIAADTLRDFREAIDVVLGDEEIEDE